MFASFRSIEADEVFVLHMPLSPEPLNGAVLSQPTDGAPRPPTARVSAPRLVALAAGVAGIAVLARQGGAHLPQFAVWVDSLGIWGPIVFIVGYAIAAVALLPGSILTLAGGAIFGVVKGTIFVFIASTLGASGAFFVARYLARGAIERRLADNPRFRAIDRAVAVEGLKIAFLLRLSPVVPYNLLNYALGLTKIRFVDYLVASVGMLPATALYVYYGKLAGDIAALAGGARIEKDAAYYIVLALGLVATLAVTTVVTRVAQRALKEATGGMAS